MRGVHSDKGQTIEVYSCVVNKAELGVQQVQLLKLEYTFLLAPLGFEKLRLELNLPNNAY